MEKNYPSATTNDSIIKVVVSRLWESEVKTLRVMS